jgi:hypothetical protein
MHFFFNKYLAITIALLCFTDASLASSVTSCETKENNLANNGYDATFDYGDASGYGAACHDTNRWQQLGNTDGNPLEGDSGAGSDAANANIGWSGEQSQNAIDSGDNGVSWRVQNSDGSWPVEFSNGALSPEATVEFKFVVVRSDEGNHQFDQLKAWTDWNGNNQFDESEFIINEKWFKNANINDVVDANTTNNNSDLGTTNNSDTMRVYTSEVVVPIDAIIGDTWMRARVICENSLSATHLANGTFLPTGYYHQGEVEDHKMTIVAQVPEPGTLLIFGSAIMGLVLSRKKA